MKTLILKIDIQQYWRSGTGKGEGSRLDATTIKDELGLPMLPGRHIKGLFRHAMMAMVEWNQCPKEIVQKFFGYGPLDDQSMSRFESQMGQLSFSSAYLSDDWLKYFKSLENQNIQQKQTLVSLFYQSIKQTAIEDELAKEQSLRTLEVAVPVELYAEISGDFTEAEWKVLQKACALIRSVGSQRTKGLGRAVLTISQKGIS